MNARTKELPAEECTEKRRTGVKYLTLQIFIFCVGVWFSFLGYCQHILDYARGNINHFSFDT